MVPSRQFCLRFFCVLFRCETPDPRHDWNRRRPRRRRRSTTSLRQRPPVACHGVHMHAGGRCRREEWRTQQLPHQPTSLRRQLPSWQSKELTVIRVASRTVIPRHVSSTTPAVQNDTPSSIEHNAAGSSGAINGRHATPDSAALTAPVDCHAAHAIATASASRDRGCVSTDASNDELDFDARVRSMY